MSVTITPNAAGAPEVNMANGNAAQVLDLLGIDFNGDMGETSGPDFHGRVLLALALVDMISDDRGYADMAGPRWIDCGRRPGYLADRLTELHDLAVWACEHNTDVAWF